MKDVPKLDKARRRRMRYAERKLKEAQRRLASANRGIAYWSRILADLRHERTRFSPRYGRKKRFNKRNEPARVCIRASSCAAALTR